MLEFLQKKYEFPDLKNKKVLFLGLGGGCDIISAYSLQFLFKSSHDARIIYGNTKNTFDKDLSIITKHIGKVPPDRIDISRYNIRISSTTIDRSLPRGEDGCPYIFHYHKGASDDLIKEICSLNFDLIVGVDTGGDSIIFGALSGAEGRDRKMVRLLKDIKIPFILVVLGAGCDGESTLENIKITFQDYNKKNKYLGSFSLDPLIPLFKSLAGSLQQTRTPNIISFARDNRLELDKEGLMIVPRGRYPKIPRELLIHGFVFGNFKDYL